MHMMQLSRRFVEGMKPEGSPKEYIYIIVGLLTLEFELKSLSPPMRY